MRRLLNFYYKLSLAEETGFEPARVFLRTLRVSNPPQWASMRLLLNFYKSGSRAFGTTPLGSGGSVCT